MSMVHPSKVTLCWSVIQTQPWFISIMAMLYVDIFFIGIDINKDWIVSVAFL